MSPRLGVLAVMAIGFVLLSDQVARGTLDGLDRATATAVARLYREPLLPAVQGLAVLGGIEATSVLMVMLGSLLWRRGFRDELWALLAFPATVALELLYKRLLFHPGPARLHHDGPSLSDLLEAGPVQNSYPSGHMARAVLVYGLIAFVGWRLARPAWRAAIVATSALAILGVAFSRLYLAVHWESDVLGGMLLGGIGVLGATIWLDRPRPEGG